MHHFYDLIPSLLTIITDHHDKTLDDASLESKVEDSDANCSEELPNQMSSSDDATDQSSVTADSWTNVDGQDIPQVIGDVNSTSVILNMETSQNETKMLELEENPSNATKDSDCSMKDGIPMIQLQLLDTEIDRTATITIEDEGCTE